MKQYNVRQTKGQTNRNHSYTRQLIEVAIQGSVRQTAVSYMVGNIRYNTIYKIEGDIKQCISMQVIVGAKIKDR